MSDPVEKQIEGQEKIQQEATEGSIHAQQLQHQGMSRSDRADLLDRAVESGLQGPRGLENLNARDFPLANLDDADITESRWNFEIYSLFHQMARPHPGSAAIGPFRVWASHGEEEPVFPTDMDEYNRSEQYTFGSYTRATRGHQMAQQENNAKQISESHLHSFEDDSGSLRDRLPK